MIGLFSLWPIVEKHYESLVDDSTWAGVAILFFLVPLSFSTISIFLGYHLTEFFIQVVLSVIAILVGFTINALVLLIGGSDGSFTDRQKNLFKKTRNHTIYALVMGLILLLLSTTIFFLFQGDVGQNSPVILISAFLVYSLGSHYIITLFLIPARLYAITDVASG